MEPVWKVELFGGVRAVRGDTAVGRFRVQKAASLLGYLAYYRRPHARELLIEHFWEDDDPATGRHKLSVALSALRQVLEPADVPDGAVIEADRNTVRLAPGSVSTDVEQFEDALRLAADSSDRPEYLARAIALYQGELLAGYYENWIFTEQQRLAHRFLDALRELVTHQVNTGDTSGAVETSLRAVAADPLSEALHQEVMRLHLELDRPAAALRQYREVERILRDELDTSPSSAFKPLLRAAREALEAGVPGGGDSDAGTVGQRGQPASVQNVETVTSKLHAVRTYVPREPGHAHQATPGSMARPAPASPTSAAPSTTTSSPTHAPAATHGALAFGSPFYVRRQADADVEEAIEARSSIVLLKGARQVGKTSLLGRALQQARVAGASIVSTDFQGLSGADFESPGTLLRALAVDMVDQLNLDADPYRIIGPERSPAVGFRRFLRREVLAVVEGPLVWGLDEVDRFFGCDFYNEIFALFRSWHNQRLLDPAGPWDRLTQVIAYATEAHLFITDIHQSPFNVGVRVELADFSLEQVAELNRMHGSPLRTASEVAQFHDLLGGHPYLVQQGLASAVRGGGWEALVADAVGEDGPFAEHLRRILLLLGRSPKLCESVREVLRGRACPTLEDFIRLRSSGILSGSSSEHARPRCRLYAESLSRHLL